MKKITVGKIMLELAKFAKNCEVSVEIKYDKKTVFADEFGAFEAVKNKNCCRLKFEVIENDDRIENHKNSKEAN